LGAQRRPGTWDEDGYTYIVDRKKSMIICGGENIFPAGVERILSNHPQISEVVVVKVDRRAAAGLAPGATRALKRSPRWISLTSAG
jgi:acyl-CoA synthetase (AMP-forming)/AMP-acid ligase II